MPLASSRQLDAPVEFCEHCPSNKNYSNQDGREALRQSGQSRAQIQRGPRGLGKWINKSIVIAERNAYLHGNNKSMPRLSMSKGGNEGGD
jgi:hypothetical protein